MESNPLSERAHPEGEEKIHSPFQEKTTGNAPPLMSVDTDGGRYHVQWDDSAPMTPLGQLVFFAQFLHAGGRWEDFCSEAPFGFTSPNAPSASLFLPRADLPIFNPQLPDLGLFV
jgi:hypothetical protein